jgi:hypothetical protein
MDVWVLSSEGHPCGVVTDERVARAFGDESNNNDYVLFILNDLSLTGITSYKEVPPPSSVKDTLETVDKINQGLDNANKKLQEIIKNKKFKSNFLNK